MVMATATAMTLTRVSLTLSRLALAAVVLAAEKERERQAELAEEARLIREQDELRKGERGEGGAAAGQGGGGRRHARADGGGGGECERGACAASAPPPATRAGNQRDTKPLLSRSPTGEFNSPLNYSRTISTRSGETRREALERGATPEWRRRCDATARGHAFLTDRTFRKAGLADPLCSARGYNHAR
eukprot:809495-Prorocentrum_minimum.AAC.2